MQSFPFFSCECHTPVLEKSFLFETAALTSFATGPYFPKRPAPSVRVALFFLMRSFFFLSKDSPSPPPQLSAGILFPPPHNGGLLLLVPLPYVKLRHPAVPLQIVYTPPSQGLLWSLPFYGSALSCTTHCWCPFVIKPFFSSGGRVQPGLPLSLW